MRGHPKIWRGVKWGGVVVTATLLFGMVREGSYDVRTFLKDPYRVSLTTYEQRFRILLSHPSWRAGPQNVNFEEVVDVPIWPLIAGAISMTAAMWAVDRAVSRRRVEGRHCPSCGYDRVGLGVDALCPECGTSA